MRIKSLLAASGLAISASLAPVMVSIPANAALIIIQDTASVSNLIAAIAEAAAAGNDAEVARLLAAEDNPTTKALALAGAAKVLANAGQNDAAADIAEQAVDAAQAPGVSEGTQQVVGVSVANVADTTGDADLATKIDNAGGAVEGAATAASTNLTDSGNNASNVSSDSVAAAQQASNAVASTVNVAPVTVNNTPGAPVVVAVTATPVNENTTGAVVINTSTNPDTGEEETTVSFAGGNSNNQGGNTTVTVVIGDKETSVSPVN